MNETTIETVKISYQTWQASSREDFITKLKEIPLPAGNKKCIIKINDIYSNEKLTSTANQSNSKEENQRLTKELINFINIRKDNVVSIEISGAAISLEKYNSILSILSNVRLVSLRKIFIDGRHEVNVDSKYLEALVWNLRCLFEENKLIEEISIINHSLNDWHVDKLLDFARYCLVNLKTLNLEGNHFGTQTMFKIQAEFINASQYCKYSHHPFLSIEDINIKNCYALICPMSYTCVDNMMEEIDALRVKVELDQEAFDRFTRLLSVEKKNNKKEKLKGCKSKIEKINERNKARTNPSLLDLSKEKIKKMNISNLMAEINNADEAGQLEILVKIFGDLHMILPNFYQVWGIFTKELERLAASEENLHNKSVNEENKLERVLIHHSLAKFYSSLSSNTNEEATHNTCHNACQIL